MPLKLAAVLQRSKDHPDQINDDIAEYQEYSTYGNRYVILHLDERPLEDFEERLQNYVKEMGFDDSSIILVDKQWDVEPEEAADENFAIPEPPAQVNAPAQPWVGEVIWARG